MTIEASAIGEHGVGRAAHDPDWRVSIPVEHCFFVLLEPSELGSPSLRLLRQIVSARSPVLDEALQRWVPMPASDGEHLQATYLLIEPGEPAQFPWVLACATERSLVERLSTSAALVASPSCLPPTLRSRLDGRVPDPRSINFLVGDLAPRAVVTLRRRREFLTAAGIVGILGLSVLGLSRRANFDHARSASLLEAATAVETRCFPQSAKIDPGRIQLLVAGEIARLQSASAGPTEASATIDAAEALASILACWPHDPEGQAIPRLHARVQSIQIVATGITLTVLLPADADPEPLLVSLRTLPNWQLQPTQRSSAPAGPSGRAEARLTLRLVPIRVAPPDHRSS